MNKGRGNGSGRKLKSTEGRETRTPKRKRSDSDEISFRTDDGKKIRAKIVEKKETKGKYAILHFITDDDNNDTRCDVQISYSGDYWSLAEFVSDLLEDLYYDEAYGELLDHCFTPKNKTKKASDGNDEEYVCHELTIELPRKRIDKTEKSIASKYFD